MQKGTSDGKDSKEVGGGNRRAGSRGSSRARKPEINRAIQTLQGTSRDLKRANRDFGGHRARAASLVDQAINELRQAKRYDDTHGNDGRRR